MGAGLALGACAGPPMPRGAGPHGSHAAQLVYQDWRTEWFPGMAQQMLEQFHAANPNIRVFYTPDPDNFAEAMMADFQAGTPPDVMAGCCDVLPVWAQRGYLLDLRPYVEADLDQATVTDWSDAQYKAFFGADGGLYALPKYHGALALYYNKDIFDRKRVDYPDGSWNHTDYHEAMQRVTAGIYTHREPGLWGSMADIAWERIQVHVNGWGGHFVDPADSTRSLIEEQPSLDAMEWLRSRMWDDRLMASFLDVQNLETRHAFIQQKLAMVEDGSWALKDILERTDFRIGVAPFPSGPVRRVTLATTDGFAIYAGTKHPDAAWALLKFLVSPTYGRAMARTHLLQPARISLVEEWVDYIQKLYPAKARDVDIAAFADGHIQGYSVTAEIFAQMAPARALIQNGWEQIFTLGRMPVSAMQDISLQVEAAQSAQG
jgi:multiple sugar transport system substrate-binding protein